MAEPPVAEGEGVRPWLGEPLLEARAAPGPGWVRRCAAWRGPHPTLALLLALALAACACLAESQPRSRERGPPAGPLVLAEQAGPRGDPALALPGLRGLAPGALGALALLLTGALAVQYACEALLCSALAATVEDLGAEFPRMDIELGAMRAWIFLGRFGMRNCRLHDREACRGGHMLLVRGLTADLAVWRFLRSAGADVEIRRLRLEGVDVVLGPAGGTSAPRRPDASAALRQLRKGRACPGRALRVAHLTIRGAVVQANGVRASLADVQYDDFSEDFGAGTAGAVASQLSAALGERALAAAQ